MNVGIFRKQYLPISETFVAAQGYGLRAAGAEPFFIGLREAKSGLHHINRSDFLSLSSNRLDYKLGRAQIAVSEALRGQKALPHRWVAKAKATNIKLLHSHFGHTGLVGMELAKKLDIPHVVTFHGHDIAPTDLSADYLKQLPKLWDSCDQIIAVSEHIRRKLLERGAPAEKIRVHYIGIDTTKFTAEDKPRTAEPTVLFVGRLVKKKGIAYLTEAMLQVQQQMPEATLTVIGNGPDEAILRAAEKKGLNVTLLGSQPPEKIQQELRRSWIFCGPSCIAPNGDEEGLGMVFLEAQACGTPVVSCFTGGIPEAVAHEETGILVTPKSAAELANAISTLLSDHSLRKTLGNNGPGFVAENFNISTQCIALSKIYQRAITRREEPNDYSH